MFMSKKLVGSERELQLGGLNNGLEKPFADEAAATSAGFESPGSFCKPFPKPNKAGRPPKPRGRKGRAAAEEDLQLVSLHPPTVA